MMTVKHYKRITLGLSDVARILANHFGLDPATADFRWNGETHPAGGFPVTIEAEIEIGAPPAAPAKKGE